MTRIVFQGDSITDAGRDYQDGHKLGDGYPKYVAELLRQDYPDREFEFINMGISGNRTWDLLDRWQTDCIALKPDILSIMIGINDTWRRYDGANAPTTAQEYEANYRRLLTDVKQHTKAKILLLEPYLIDVPDKPYREDLNPKIDAVRRLAREFADVFVPLDGLFAAACVGNETTHWSPDGVHPNETGARFIADAYLKAVKTLL